MSAPSSDPRLDGSVVAIDAGHQAVCFYRHYPHPVAEVWLQLSRPSLLRHWLAAADRLDPAEGGSVVLRWLNTDPEGRTVIATGTVTAFDPPSLLQLDLDPHGRVRFELTDEGGGTALAFSASLPAPIDEPAQVLAGWHLHLDYLAQALAGGEVDWQAWDQATEWEPLRAAYAEALGAG
ncbi:SRPBCC domain-containing protein [Streptacidiphilus fuscans]|uniref:SRPBCC domain-containing protein n=1 Tax=Streptacidiphilus fuscans TaxID=2789292 RepID=A0A931B1S6_9ACTN|nr:SRPBCC domain-containing protein [Streptacidiphilus fuscans]MBF9068696.1 SRPBCC domain-containing protein [Streptacidiphilus fuscans]